MIKFDRIEVAAGSLLFHSCVLRSNLRLQMAEPFAFITILLFALLYRLLIAFSKPRQPKISIFW
jgi:hypothetical protein